MRLHDWQVRYDEVVAKCRNTPFQWGQHDCCLWAATVVEAITGTDPAAAYRGTYDTAAGAMKVIKELGGIAEIPTPWLGEPIAPQFANVGDIILVYQDRESLAVCNGKNTLVVAPEGLYSIPTLSSFCKKAWRT